MLRNWLLPGALLSLAAVYTTPSLADKGDVKHERIVSLQDIPAAARDTIQREGGGYPIIKVEEETHTDGHVVYEAEMNVNGGKLEVFVAPDGTLVRRNEPR